MNIDQMAHEFAMKLVGNPNTPLKDINSIVCASWSYVDAMQAEADKRKPKGLPEVLFEPDWSQAPKWARYWTADDLAYYWWSLEPKFISDAWHFAGGRADICEAPSFSYQGDWKNSLRKRP